MDDVEELEAAARAVVGRPLVLDVPARVDREGELLQGQGVLLLPAVLQSLFNNFLPRSTLTHGTATSIYTHEEQQKIYFLNFILYLT